jgi:hypothetical protein
MKGSSPLWRSWVDKPMQKRSVIVKVNNDIGSHFQSKMKGNRQGDPLSPMLFSIVVDILAFIINIEKEEYMILVSSHI